MTIIQTRLRDWLPFLLSGRPHQVIGGPDDPYLLRWYLIPRNPVINLYLHKFLRSDDDRALHDHPWWFASWILKGTYLEYTEVAPNPHPRRRWSLAYRKAEHRHRVALVHGFNTDGSYGPQPCWTLIATGRRVRTWGFWCKGYTDYLDMVTTPDRFIPWQEFGDAGCGEP